MTTLYYTAPSDEIFEEVRRAAISVWEALGAHPSYTEEKVGKIRDIKNVSDNLMYMVAMFDYGNQNALAGRLSEEARLAIRERMEDDVPSFLIPF